MDGAWNSMLCELNTTARQAGRLDERGSHTMAINSSISNVDVTTLRHALRGSVLAPGDETWDIVRPAWNLAVDQHPAADRPARVRPGRGGGRELRRTNGLRVAAQGTGHGAGPIGSLDTVLVRTSGCAASRSTPWRRSARVEAGVLWEDVIEPRGRARPRRAARLLADVGVVGYSLGGGMGWLARSHGLPPTA